MNRKPGQDFLFLAYGCRQSTLVQLNGAVDDGAAEVCEEGPRADVSVVI